MANLMRVRVRLVYDGLDKAMPHIKEQLAEQIKQAAFAVQAEAQASMRGPKSGRSYAAGRVSKKMTKALGQVKGLRSHRAKKGTTMAIVGQRIHRASAPGEAPAIDTGRLVNAIQTKQIGPLTWMVHTGRLRYAAILEYGSRRMAARPFLRPAAVKVKPWLDARVREIKALP